MLVEKGYGVGMKILKNSEGKFIVPRFRVFEIRLDCHDDTVGRDFICFTVHWTNHRNLAQAIRTMTGQESISVAITHSTQTNSSPRGCYKQSTDEPTTTSQRGQPRGKSAGFKYQRALEVFRTFMCSFLDFNLSFRMAHVGVGNEEQKYATIFTPQGLKFVPIKQDPVRPGRNLHTLAWHMMGPSREDLLQTFNSIYRNAERYHSAGYLRAAHMLYGSFFEKLIAAAATCPLALRHSNPVIPPAVEEPWDPTSAFQTLPTLWAMAVLRMAEVNIALGQLVEARRWLRGVFFGGRDALRSWPATSKFALLWSSPFWGNCFLPASLLMQAAYWTVVVELELGHYAGLTSMVTSLRRCGSGDKGFTNLLDDLEEDLLKTDRPRRKRFLPDDWAGQWEKRMMTVHLECKDD